MWEFENSFQRILEDALADVPYVIAAGLIVEKRAADGIEMEEQEHQRLVEHLKNASDEQFLFGDASQGERLRIEITDADIALIDDRLDCFMTEGVPAIIASAGEKAAELILADLHAGWAEESARQRLEREGFRQRLDVRWGRGIELLRMMLTSSREFGDLANTTLRCSEEQESPVLADVLLRLHARACQVTDEIICLCLLAEGFSDGAMARWRTLHEVAAVSLFLKEQGEPVAQRYVEHEVIESARAARDYDDCHEQLGYEPICDAELESIRRQHEQALRSTALTSMDPMAGRRML